MARERLLVFNCHEAWIHQLEGLMFDLDVVVGLPGRHTQTWDLKMRPLPRNARTLQLSEAVRSPSSYYAAIAHSVTDLLDMKAIACPKLIVLHTTLEGRALEQNSPIDPKAMGAQLSHFLTLIGGRAIATSALKARSWGIACDIVSNGVEVGSYLPYVGDLRSGIRVSNHFNRRRRILLADFHERAFADVPLQLIGHNEDIVGARPAEDWNELKALLSRHRFYVHTAETTLEDGYNFALLEAMAAGLPVLGNRHPSSPVEHETSGFLSDDPSELNAYAKLLLDDAALAARMGAAARARVLALYPLQQFHAGMERSLALTQRGYRARARALAG